jgi:hypothetical protein
VVVVVVDGSASAETGEAADISSCVAATSVYFG